MKNTGYRVLVFAACVLAVCTLTGCGLSGENGYTREELNNLAKLEIYEAESDALLITIEDEETLYRYNQLFSASMNGEDLTEWEAETENYYESGEGELEEMAKEMYSIVVYKYPAAKFGDKEPVKFLTMTLYEDTDIARIIVAEESIKIISLPEEFLTVHYRMSEEESEFYESLYRLSQE